MRGEWRPPRQDTKKEAKLTREYTRRYGKSAKERQRGGKNKIIKKVFLWYIQYSGIQKRLAHAICKRILMRCLVVVIDG